MLGTNSSSLDFQKYKYTLNEAKLPTFATMNSVWIYNSSIHEKYVQRLKSGRNIDQSFLGRTLVELNDNMGERPAMPTKSLPCAMLVSSRCLKAHTLENDGWGWFWGWDCQRGTSKLISKELQKFFFSLSSESPSLVRHESSWLQMFESAPLLNTANNER